MDLVHIRIIIHPNLCIVGQRNTQWHLIPLLEISIHDCPDEQVVLSMNLEGIVRVRELERRNELEDESLNLHVSREGTD
jgi:hypothetical protein